MHKSYKFSARFQFESQELTARYLDILKDVHSMDVLSDSSRHIHVFQFRAPELSQRDQISGLLKRKKQGMSFYCWSLTYYLTFSHSANKKSSWFWVCHVTHRSVCHAGLKVNPEESTQGFQKDPRLFTSLCDWNQLLLKKNMSPALQLIICKPILSLFKALRRSCANATEWK